MSGTDAHAAIPLLGSSLGFRGTQPMRVYRVACSERIIGFYVCRPDGEPHVRLLRRGGTGCGSRVDVTS